MFLYEILKNIPKKKYKKVQFPKQSLINFILYCIDKEKEKKKIIYIFKLSNYLYQHLKKLQTFDIIDDRFFTYCILRNMC